MSGNKTFTIIKPDAFEAAYSGPIIEKIEDLLSIDALETLSYDGVAAKLHRTRRVEDELELQ